MTFLINTICNDEMANALAKYPNKFIYTYIYKLIVSILILGLCLNEH